MFGVSHFDACSLARGDLADGGRRRFRHLPSGSLLAFAPRAGRHLVGLSPCPSLSALSALFGGMRGSLVGSATAGSLVRSAAIALLRGMFAGMLFGLMMANHSAGSSPQDAMMAGMMPDITADCRPSYPAFSG